MEDLICGSVAQCRLLSREAGVRYHDRTTIRDYNSNWERSAAFVTKRANGLTFFFLCFFKDYKPEVPSHNSFESQLCGTLKNAHAIRKEKARSSRCCGLSFTQKTSSCFFFFQEGQW